MEIRFKYQINHFLSIQPRHITVDDVRRLLEKQYGISQEIFNRDRFIMVSDPTEVPEERLNIYAFVLHVSISQLTQVREPEVVYHVVNKPINPKDR